MKTLDKMALARKLDAALLHLVVNNRYLAVQLYRLGEVRFSEAIPTAAVAITKKGRLRYLWNPAFLDSLTEKQVAFVCLHEAFHVACEHLFRVKDFNPKLWNLATDAFINDFITQNFKGFLEAHEGLVSGPALIGRYASDLTAEDIYSRIPDDVKDKFKSFDDHSLWGDPGDDEDEGEGGCGSEALNDLRSRVRGTVRRGAAREMESGAGCFPVGLDINVVTTKTQFNWKSLLNQFLASRHTVDFSWKMRRKTTLHMPPDPYLPGTHKSEQKWSIALMVDTSGSMHTELEYIVSRLKSLPKDVEVNVCWFDTEVYPTTLDEVMAGKAKGGGGTAFTPPITWAESLPSSPDVYIMVTDGYAFDSYKVASPRKWLWLITQNGQRIENQGICVEM